MWVYSAGENAAGLDFKPVWKLYRKPELWHKTKVKPRCLLGLRACILIILSKECLKLTRLHNRGFQRTFVKTKQKQNEIVNGLEIGKGFANVRNTFFIDLFLSSVDIAYLSWLIDRFIIHMRKRVDCNSHTAKKLM